MSEIQAARAISAALRSELVVSDASFDQLYPTAERYRSPFHWTPVEIAKRACGLLATRPGGRILDVGSGVGKLCLVGALTASHARWVGIERDRGRAEIARRVAVRLGVYHAVQFVHGDATAIDWSSFDSIYLFNPFAEQRFDRDIDAMSRRERYVRLVDTAQRRLRETAPGTRVVTYHGIGGDMPACFELTHREPAGDDQLCVWTRITQTRRGQTH